MNIAHVFSMGLLGLSGAGAVLTGASLQHNPSGSLPQVKAPVVQNQAVSKLNHDFAADYRQAQSSTDYTQISEDQAKALAPKLFDKASDPLKSDFQNDKFYKYTNSAGQQVLVVVGQDSKPFMMILVGVTPSLPSGSPSTPKLGPGLLQ
jgi:hypothetical protein